VHSARHLPPDSPDVARALRRRGREVWPLHRRGADLGHAVTVHRRAPDRQAAMLLWRAGEAVFVPGVLGPLDRHRAPIAASLRMFDRLRGGAAFVDELDRRLRHDPDLRYAGSTVDKDDPRELERVFVDAKPGGNPVAHDLWAKLAWIAVDASDR
jgi:hypothetical protein